MAMGGILSGRYRSIRMILGISTLVALVKGRLVALAAMLVARERDWKQQS